MDVIITAIDIMNFTIKKMQVIANFTIKNASYRQIYYKKMQVIANFTIKKMQVIVKFTTKKCKLSLNLL